MRIARTTKADQPRDEWRMRELDRKTADSASSGDANLPQGSVGRIELPLVNIALTASWKEVGQLAVPVRPGREYLVGLRCFPWIDGTGIAEVRTFVRYRVDGAAAGPNDPVLIGAQLTLPGDGKCVTCATDRWVTSAQIGVTAATGDATLRMWWGMTINQSGRVGGNYSVEDQYPNWVDVEDKGSA